VEETVDEEDVQAESKMLSITDLKKKDYYRVLGLEELKWRATDDQIRSAYRKLVLKYHPDKMANPTPEDRQIFLHIQEAYEALGTIEKRRAYDSADADLVIPLYEEDDDFFECFGNVFYDYSRFSSIQPAYVLCLICSVISSPLLGTMETPWKEVELFYKFWREFKSWRIYNAFDEYNPDVGCLERNMMCLYIGSNIAW